jgi:hypothetical protein
MQCNIDSRGRAVRLVAGVITVGLGGLLLALGLLGGIGQPWIAWAGGGLIVAGGFGVFEARAGWCALRAMGVRTPV